MSSLEKRAAGRAKNHEPGTAEHCLVCQKPRGQFPMAHRGDRACSQKCEKRLAKTEADREGWDA